MDAVLLMDGWAGRSESPCVVVGETPTRYRVRFDARTRIAGRRRYAEAGAVVLIPKHAIRLARALSALGAESPVRAQGTGESLPPSTMPGEVSK